MQPEETAAIKNELRRLAVFLLRDLTDDKRAPIPADFEAVAKKLNRRGTTSPTGKRWTTTHVRQAHRAYANCEFLLR